VQSANRRCAGLFHFAPDLQRLKEGLQLMRRAEGTRSIDDTDAPPLSWRPATWLKEAGHPFSRPILYSEIKRGALDARKVGKNTLILTSPKDYLMALPKTLGPPVGRARRKRAGRAA
jgi:hypothetical protein